MLWGKIMNKNIKIISVLILGFAMLFSVFAEEGDSGGDNPLPTPAESTPAVSKPQVPATSTPVSPVGKNTGLNNDKKTIKDELDSYFGEILIESDYTQDQIKKINAIKQTGKSEIDKSKEENELDSAFEKAKDAIKEIELNVKKEQLISELQNYYGAGTTTEDFKDDERKKEINDAREAAISAIEKVTSVRDIENTFETEKQKIDAVKTDAEFALSEAEKKLDNARKDKKDKKRYGSFWEEANQKLNDGETSNDQGEIKECADAINDIITKVETAKKTVEPVEKYLQFLLMLAFGISIMCIIVSMIFTILFTKKSRRLCENLKTELDEKTGGKISANDFNSKYEELSREHKELSDQVNKQKTAIDNITAEQLSIKSSIEKQKTIIPSNQQVSMNNDSARPQGVNSRDTVADFNAWAANPNNRLPDEFYYVAGTPTLKEQQPIAKSDSQTKWISNNSGKKYLFPNPKLFDQMTDKNELYTIIGMLKGIGENKAQITKPCEIGDNGFIRFQGELKLI
ncbi:MAG: hypothetical protein Ta2B_18430 [Termitinemataceae bacterium]|nr:MAG: hypothetical protein Ta2B_18430 [Termitinemataceae bacterium]